MKDTSRVEQLFGHRLRSRVCGICIKEHHLLLVRHSGIGEEGELWMPPGGGMEWGQSAPENLEREFLEETGLTVKTGPFLFVHEYIKSPLHAVELFFQVTITGGELKKGTDPEFRDDQQIIQEVRFMSFREINLLPPDRLHGIFKTHKSAETLNNASGYFNFEK